MYTAENYGECYAAEHFGAENVNAENNIADNFAIENVKTSAKGNEATKENMTFASASMEVEKALQSPIPRPALGMPPPEVPSSQRPPRSDRTALENVPVEKETRRKTKVVKKVWRSAKMKKKVKEK